MRWFYYYHTARSLLTNAFKLAIALPFYLMVVVGTVLVTIAEKCVGEWEFTLNDFNPPQLYKVIKENWEKRPEQYNKWTGVRKR